MQNHKTITVGWPDPSGIQATRTLGLYYSHLFKRDRAPPSSKQSNDAFKARHSEILQKIKKESQGQDPLLYMWRIRLWNRKTSLPPSLIRPPLQPYGSIAQIMEPRLRDLFSIQSPSCPICGEIYDQDHHWITRPSLHRTAVRTPKQKTTPRPRLFTPCRQSCLTISYSGSPITNPDRWQHLQSRLLHPTKNLPTDGSLNA